jgi:type IV secretory pathway TrbF-like protein
MVTSTYDPVMKRILRDANPFDLVGKVRRSVEIESVIKITGNSQSALSTYQIDWTESTTEIAGGANAPRNRRMRALVTIKLIPPDNTFIKVNPLGIFIENCEWTEW